MEEVVETLRRFITRNGERGEDFMSATFNTCPASSNSNVA